MCHNSLNLQTQCRRIGAHAPCSFSCQVQKPCLTPSIKKMVMDTFLHHVQKIHYNHFSLHQIFSCLESFVGNSPPHFGSICTTRSLRGDNDNTYNEHHRGKSCKLETASRCLLPMSLVTSLSPALICEFPSQQIHPQPRLVINSTVIWTHGL